MSANDLEIRQLRAFVALVDQGSITAAAQALGVAQSTLSESLSALTRALGTPVVLRRRGARAAHLTRAGKALLPHARSVLAVLESAQSAVTEISHQARTTVDVGANESVTTYLLPSALAALRGHWPNARFAVSVATCVEIYRAVADRTFDVGLHLEVASCVAGTVGREQGVPATALSVVPIAEVPLAMFCSPRQPIARQLGRDGVHPSQLSDLSIFVSDGAGRCYDLLVGYFRGAAQIPRFEPTGSIEGVKQNVMRDRRAVGVLPLYSLEEELRAGTLRPVRLSVPLPSLRLDAVLPSDGPAHPAALELVKLLTEFHRTHSSRPPDSATAQATRAS